MSVQEILMKPGIFSKFGTRDKSSGDACFLFEYKKQQKPDVVEVLYSIGHLVWSAITSNFQTFYKNWTRWNF